MSVLSDVFIEFYVRFCYQELINKGLPRLIEEIEITYNVVEYEMFASIGILLRTVVVQPLLKRYEAM